jgi:hypothetical protein
VHYSKNHREVAGTDGKLIQRNIDDLREHVKYIEQTIAILEHMPKPIKSTRGRRSMGAAERREVSERMRKYWAKRQQRLESEAVDKPRRFNRSLSNEPEERLEAAFSIGELSTDRW